MTITLSVTLALSQNPNLYSATAAVNALVSYSTEAVAKLVLHRSSIINKIVINIMIIEVMYTAKSTHSFVDSRPRDDICRIRSLACYTESVTHDGRPRISTWKQWTLLLIDVIDKGQLPPSSTSMTEYPKVFQNWWGKTKNQRGRLIDFLCVNWSC